MLFIIVFAILACIILFKLHDRLTFQRGRLTRSYDRTSTRTITKMGSDQFIELSFGTVHYIYHPSSLPSLPLNIFVHGYSTPMEMWQDIFQPLVKDNQPCLVYDLYGRGWSDSPYVPMNVDIFVCQLAELLYALNLPYEKYNLFGVSMGGVIIQRFTELYPTRVSKLILCCSGGLNIVKPSKLIMFILSIPILGPIVFKFVMQHGNARKDRLQWAFPDNEKYEQYKKLFKSGWQQHPGYLRALFSTVTNFDFESSLKSIEFISKLNIPILIIWGDKDPLTTVDNAYRYHQLYKNSLLKIIPGATHMILIEHSEQIIESIRDFLKK
jgi:pimeloyl-ACP methyl ester carboxylesterase